MRTLPFVIGVLWLWATPILAADIGVEAKKLVIQDKLVTASKAKVVYRSRDHSLVSKGSGTDVSMIDAQFEVSYVNGATSGSFLMPSGVGWLGNNTRAAKYVNTSAPAGGGTKLGFIKIGGILKLVGKSLGDTPIDILAAGDPGPSGVLTVFTVNNGGETNRHCGVFTDCIYNPQYQGTGATLSCRNGMPAACP